MRLNDKISTTLVKGYVADFHDWEWLENTAVILNPSFQSPLCYTSWYWLFFNNRLGSVVTWSSHIPTTIPTLVQTRQKENFLSDSSNTDKQDPVWYLFLYLHLRIYHAEFIKNFTLFLVGQNLEKPEVSFLL